MSDLKEKFNFSDRLKSFRFAFHGLKELLKYEHNARIHLVLVIISIVAGILLRISSSDWIAIAIVSGLVFASECFNTAIESISDLVSPEDNEKIKKAKDVAAGGVLISAIVSVIVGLIVFIPEILRLLKG
jgi:diacylglycerol kinase (ATP)